MTLPIDNLSTDQRLLLGRWLAATRPRTLLLAITPVVGGVLLAVADSGSMAFFTALATLLAAAGIQIGTNLHNDAADFERGTDSADRLGPPRASAQGWFRSDEVKRAAHIAFLTSFVLGLLLVLRGGWPILMLGLAAIAAGYAYTSGPKPIAYGPLGEMYVLGFFGIAAVAGTYYLQTLSLSAGAISLGIALGLPAAAVLLLNNYRDFDGDRRAGRRTLCHVLDRPAVRYLYAGLLLLPIPLMLFGGLPGPTWPVLLAAPIAMKLIRRLFDGADGTAINPMLGRTAQYQALLVALYGLGLLLGWLFGSG
ncbi:MAG: 1,4-dihydroxy-2-naphthoate octaprenyltransferase [Thiohalocapsa sp.]|jgi:1,4-dihydroxy-2-naphthoate octaprenyltransferase